MTTTTLPASATAHAPMITKFPIARDDALYCAFPDVTRVGERLVCVFAVCTHHGNRDYTEIRCTHSDDRGRTWSPARAIVTPSRGDPRTVSYWNCPRITALADGRLVVVVDRTIRDGGAVSENLLMISEDRGETWSSPRQTPVIGIVPDRLLVLRHGPHAGRWLLSAHQRSDDGVVRSRQRLWWSDDQGATWSDPVVIAAHADLHLCEGSMVELPGGELCCFLRENSFTGLDAFVTVSRDQGATWDPVWAFPMPACHRPVAGMLQDGRVLITHRFMQGGQGWVGWWTQNTFLAFTDVASCLAGERKRAHARILPLDYDRSEESDTGYTGWVQFADGEIVVVNYCLDDWPRAQIRGYSLRPESVCLPTGAAPWNRR